WRKRARVSRKQPLPQRDLVINEFFVRTEDCKARKNEHLAWLDANVESREQHIRDTVFEGGRKSIVLERNAFPYSTPEDIEHWTLWSTDELADWNIEAFVTSWLLKNRPDVKSWALEDNAGDRSILW
ncbi:unnamed protein product, partial [Chrysoparadoxa australica]